MIQLVNISDEEVQKILPLQESHFVDLKSINITPAKLTKTISAFTNAEGGELFIGIEDDPRIWDGFNNQEAANGHIQPFEELFPLGNTYNYAFLKNRNQSGLVLKIDVGKSLSIKEASNGKIYLRRGAQNIPQTNQDSIDRLKKNKGVVSFESETVNVGIDVIENSVHIIDFVLNVVPSTEPLAFLKKQQLIHKNHPTVAGVLLYAEEPQAIIPKRCGLKIYQYTTSEEEGNRETLLFDPISIEGNLYNQIRTAVDETARLIEAIRIMTAEGLQQAHYPIEALHEIITNAVLHRDYSIADDIHVRIFDNRVEILSPGTLPGHITPENILEERFARNGAIVRLINKFPDPPNKDVGEGLNTAFRAMKTMRLKDPEIEQIGLNVLVRLKHESLGTPQELIMRYLETHETIANRHGREICYIHSENTMKHILKSMVDAGLIMVIKGKTVFDTVYKKIEK